MSFKNYVTSNAALCEALGLDLTNLASVVITLSVLDPGRVVAEYYLHDEAADAFATKVKTYTLIAEDDES